MPRKYSTPRKKRTAATVAKRARQRPGARAFRDRLATLIRDQSNSSRTAFAKLLGVGTSHVSKWCDDGVAPGGEMLATIADRTGVSLDWLVTGNGHDGQQSAEPVLRGQWRDTPTLESDLLALLTREVGALEWLSASDFTVDTTALLTELVTRVRAEMVAYDQWYRMDYRRAETALFFAEQAIAMLPVEAAKGLMDASDRADLNIIPPVVAGLCAAPPKLRYVAASRTAFNGELPEEIRDAWRSKYAEMHVGRMRFPEGVATIEVNGVEMYREHKEKK